MEYVLRVVDIASRLDLVRDTCLVEDPSVLVDVHPRDGALRIATQLDAGTLAATLAAAGVSVRPGELEQLPSVCCGGCSG